MTYRPNRTRTGIYPFDLCHASGTWASQPFQQRRLFKISQTAKRFRVHLRNWNQVTDTGGAAMTNVQIGIGIPVIGTDGLPTGATTTTPVTVQSSTSVAAGAELISPWITPSTFTISAYTQYFLTYGFTTAASGNTMFSGGLAWQSYTATDAFVAAPSQTRNFNAAFLQVWIEYEFSDDAAPSILVVGNSLSLGSNGVVDHPGEQGAWHQVWALNQKGFAASLAVSTAFAAQFKSGNTRWDLYNSCAVAPEFDAIVYFALTSSDTVDYSITTNVQPDFKGVVDRGKAVAAAQGWGSPRHIATNIPPRIAFTGDGTVNTTTEYKRRAQNTWHHLLGGGVEQCLDVDSLVTDWANPARIRYAVNADDTHFNARGHNEFAALMSSAVQRR